MTEPSPVTDNATKPATVDARAAALEVYGPLARLRRRHQKPPLKIASRSRFTSTASAQTLAASDDSERVLVINSSASLTSSCLALHHLEETSGPKGVVVTEIVLFNSAVSLVSATAGGLVARYRRAETVGASELSLLRQQTAEVLAVRRHGAKVDMIKRNIQAIADVSLLIEELGGGPHTLRMNYMQLDVLHQELMQLARDI